MWNNFLAEIVKHLPSVDVKWNKSPHGNPQSSQARFGEPLSRAAAHFTREAYFTHEVHLTNPARDLFHWKKPFAFANGFFLVIPFQNQSAEQAFSKSIRGFRSVGRRIPWRWWEMHATAVFRGATPYLQTDLCRKQFIRLAILSAMCKNIHSDPPEFLAQA